MGIVLGGNCPWWELSGCQLSWVGIVLGGNCPGANCPGANCPGWELSGGNCPGANCPGANCPVTMTCKCLKEIYR